MVIFTWQRPYNIDEIQASMQAATRRLDGLKYDGFIVELYDKITSYHH